MGGEGNVHTGATPPWLKQDEEEEDEAPPIGPSLDAFLLHSNLIRYLALVLDYLAVLQESSREELARTQIEWGLTSIVLSPRKIVMTGIACWCVCVSGRVGDAWSVQCAFMWVWVCVRMVGVRMVGGCAHGE